MSGLVFVGLVTQVPDDRHLDVSFLKKVGLSGLGFVFPEKKTNV